MERNNQTKDEYKSLLKYNERGFYFAVFYVYLTVVLPARYNLICNTN